MSLRVSAWENRPRLLVSGLLLAAAAVLLLLAAQTPHVTDSPRLRTDIVLGAVALTSLLPKLWTRRGWPFLSWGILAAVAIFAITTLVVQPSFKLAGFAPVFYAPFSETLHFTGPLGNRVLTPLLARLLFLSGDRYYILGFGETFLLVFLLVWFFHLSLSSVKPPQRALATAACACAVAFSSIVYFQLTGPSDPVITTYILVVLFLIVARPGASAQGRWRPWAKGALYCLMAANHENSVFIFPFLALYAAGGLRPASLLREGALFVPALALMIALKFTVAGIHAKYPDGVSQFQEVRRNFFRAYHTLFSGSWYYVFLYPAITTFTLAWLLVIVRTGRAVAAKHTYTAALVVTGIASPALQMLMAGDWARYMGLAFPSVALSAIGLWSWRRYGPAFVVAIAIANPLAWYLYARFADLQWLAP